ncbi:two-component system, sensor histidine kinase [Rhodocyclaceae bacterium]|nr:two-component system, sensor histidine kinase [Rhodocyclaceae bacterium]
MSRLFPCIERHSIRYRLFRLIVVAVTAALAISMVAGAALEWGNKQEQTRQSLLTIADAVGVAASAAVAFHDGKAAREALNIMAARREIEAAAIYGLEGALLASYGSDAGLPRTVDAGHEHLPAFSLLSPVTTLLQPIRLDDSTIGHIFIRANLAESRFRFLLQAFLVIAVNLLGLALVLGFGFKSLDRIVKPVKDLADTARQVRQDSNFSLRAAVAAGDDEIGDLVISFNAMLAEIERRQRDLAEYQGNLERLVLERTEALHATNRKLQAAKEAAETATVSKSRFLAAASHDLRQPIQAINLFNDALAKTPLNEDQKRISHYLGQSTRSLGDLLDALLDISKLDAGAITPTLETIDIYALFGSIDAEFAALAAAKALKFRLHFPPGEMALYTDGKLLQSLLRNLVGNAIKYTQRGGVLVGIRRSGDQAVIQVWDTGIGIAPESIGRIYDEYFQIHNPERNRAKGLGLGLAIAKRLARLLGSDIACRSRPGRGSLFEFRLPLVARDAATGDAGDEATPAPAASPAGRHVVVVEDDEMVAQALTLSLGTFGLSATAYGSGEQALADPRARDAYAYISDFQLPGMNGVQFLEAVQQRTAGPIRAVVLTGDTSPERLEVAHPTWKHLFKPIDLAKLLAAIEDQASG